MVVATDKLSRTGFYYRNSHKCQKADAVQYKVFHVRWNDKNEVNLKETECIIVAEELSLTVSRTSLAKTSAAIGITQLHFDIYLRAVGRQVLWSAACVCLCVCVCVCVCARTVFVRKISEERVHESPPNSVGGSRGWTSRRSLILVLIGFRMRIQDHFSLSVNLAG